MADRIETFNVTVPAGTLSGSPIDFPLSFDLGIVTDIEIVIPPGPSGLVGFRIHHSGNAVIPRSGSQYIITDNEIIKWPLTKAPYGDKWVLRAYNEDVYAHTLYLRFLVNEAVTAVLPTIQPLMIAPVVDSQQEPVIDGVA